jgi:hypothetical protein
VPTAFSFLFCLIVCDQIERRRRSTTTDKQLQTQLSRLSASG